MKTEAVIEHITGWLRDYCQGAGTRGFVVGVSGGIDSAVASTLAARTGLPLLVVGMSIHQSAEQVVRARDHVAFLKKSHETVDSVDVELTGVFDRLIEALPDAPDEAAHEKSLVNTRARLRMTTLYYFAALHRRLVVGTGNKVEDFGIGFFTKYGDGGVDLSPIADLVKSEVYQLGRALGVDRAILTASPTDGLWSDDRTDEQQIGASYPELEWAMGFDGDEQGLDDRQRRVLAVYRRLNADTRHKTEPVPVCIIPDTLR